MGNDSSSKSDWRLTVACNSVSIFIAAVLTWGARHNITADGVSYLEIGERFDINPMWSFLYSWIQGLAHYAFQPSLQWKYPVAHLLNFIGYLFALTCFNFLLRLKAPQKLWILSSHLIFIWASLILINVDVIAPDIYVSGFVYLAAFLLIRIHEGSNRFILLGLVLGMGYLMKTPMLPLGIVFMVMGAFVSVKRALLGLAVMMLTASIYIIPISVERRRFTLGDNGKVNYAWYVNGIESRYWQGGPNSPRILLSHPTIYEFAEPIQVTYPIWYDPAYWYEGVKTPVDLGKLIRVLSRNLVSFFGSSLLTGPLCVCLALICMFSREKIDHCYLFVPCIASLFLFSAVHIEMRYIAPFVVLCCLLLAPKGKAAFVSIGIIVLCTAYPVTRYFVDSLRDRRNEGLVYVRTAEMAKKFGLVAGDKIASLEYSNPFHARWAYLARVRIVSEIYSESESPDFVNLPQELQQRALDVFRGTGARMVVSRNCGPGWSRLENTPVCYFKLR